MWPVGEALKANKPLNVKQLRDGYLAVGVWVLTLLKERTCPVPI
jgi:hypothetical protein